MQVEIRRYETEWMAIACMRCRTVIWEGEESWWDLARCSAVLLINFLWRHQCRSGQ